MNLHHLTDEQFADLLAGARGDAGAQAHLERCETCRNELATLGNAVGDLNFASLQWAEQHALRIEVPSRWVLNWNALPGWGASMAAVLLFGIAVGAHLQSGRQAEPALLQAHAIPVPSADEVAKDNRLMRSIDNELSEQVSLSGMDASSHAGHHRSVRQVIN